MEQHLQALIANVEKWRSAGLSDYWITVDYTGAALNRMGIHTMAVKDGKLWHQWHREWREIDTGSDFWLFSVPGSFALARDMFSKVLMGEDVPDDAVQVRYNDQYGYVEYLRIKAAKRDAANFTFEVKSFGEGVHEEFDR